MYYICNVKQLKNNKMNSTLNFIDEMGVKASMIVMSNLSDVQTEINFMNELNCTPNANMLSLRLDFAKWLIIKLNGNLEQYINCQLAYDEFCKFKGIK